MNMVPYDANCFITTLTQAVEVGDVPEARIDDAVRRILRVKFQMGLFEHPMAHTELFPEVGSEAHHALAREAMAKSMVLFKNENALLPLLKEIGHLFVSGLAADDMGIQVGGWTIEWQGKTGNIIPGTTILDGIQAAVSLQTDYIVVIQSHINFRDPTMAIFLEGFQRLQRDGKVRAYGVSISDFEYLKAFNHDGNCATLQIDYSILNRMPEADIFPYCLENNIGVIVRGALAMGILTGKFIPETRFPENDWRRRWRENEDKY